MSVQTFSNLTEVLDRIVTLQEAITRASIDRALKPTQQVLTNQLSILFHKQSLDLLKRLDKLAKYFTEAEKLREDFFDIFDSVSAATSDLMMERIDTNIGVALRRGGTDILSALDVKLKFNLKNPLAIKYMATRGTDAIEDIDNTTKNQLLTILNNGVSSGWSYDKVAVLIREKYDFFSEYRARLIAVTELGNAYSAGSLAAVKTAQTSGLTFEKKWLTSNDELVSEECRTNQDDGWIGLEDTFSSGDQRPLRFPGCRCVLQMRRKGSQ